MDPLQRRRIGNTELEVTALGLGGVFVGGRDSSDGSTTDYEAAIDTLHLAWDLGIRYFDTAPFYGRGRSEIRFGAALREKPRADFVLSSKVGRLLVPAEDEPGTWQPEGIPYYNAQFDMSRDGILRAFEESLERHQLGHLDIVYVHDPDWEDLGDEAIATAFPTLVELKEQGIIKALGTGMNQWELMYRFMQALPLDVVLLAGRYTLLDQSAFETFMPYCAEVGTSVVVGGPYNSGILAAETLDDSVWFNYDTAPKAWIDKARRIKAVCDEFAVSMKAAALQFPLAHPAVASVIPGAANAAQLRENFALVSEHIPPAFWQRLAELELLPEGAPCPG